MSSSSLITQQEIFQGRLAEKARFVIKELNFAEHIIQLKRQRSFGSESDGFANNSDDEQIIHQLRIEVIKFATGTCGSRKHSGPDRQSLDKSADPYCRTEHDRHQCI
jgi:hypothetical protein